MPVIEGTAMDKAADHSEKLAHARKRETQLAEEQREREVEQALKEIEAAKVRLRTAMVAKIRSN